jgi:hypothetical protein
MSGSNKLVRNLAKIMLAMACAFTFTGCGSPADEGSQLHRAPGGSGTGAAGGKCKVVSGPNKGKTGTYDSEGWCTGSWGGTECVGSDGKSNGKCQDIKKVVVVRPIEVAPIVGTARP